MIISIDPGKHGAGVAVFEDGELSWASYVKGKGWFDTAREVFKVLCRRYPVDVLYKAELVAEVMNIYMPKNSKGDPNKSLTPLIQMAAALAGFLGTEPTEYLPKQWKGQQPKAVSNRLTKAMLSKEELDRIEMPAASLQHNVWDAIGIGIAYRQGVKRAYKNH